MVQGIPAVNISILRQATSVGMGQPLLISGRVTFFGFGIPTLVRVTLNGPSFDPQVITFDTFSSPVSGDYNVAVIAEKDGTYEVFAQAFPPIVLPIPGDSSLTLPALAESGKPPIVVGAPVSGGVTAELPGGRETLPIPPVFDLEIFTPITIGAPVIPITIGNGRAPAPAFPFPFPRLGGGPADQPAGVVITPVIIPAEMEEEVPTGADTRQPGEVVGAQILSLELT